ncbi:MerR family transcriptional regulator [Pseudaeromonas sp. ZJS20]|uniref:MerR family transcriptional regulator n=1 Tax=Pseudaeromonas aegiceratis TaxID=3153928 RepID=UPI00390C5D43
MRIQEFARRTGLSVHTLRYYEQIGLLAPVSRTAAGHRRYGEQELAWVGFIQRLKATGMPLAQIQHYAQLRRAGDTSLTARRQLLEGHALQLTEALAVQQAHLAALEQKIAWYRQQEKDLDLE